MIRKYDQAGFTLLELLISLSLSAMLLTILSVGINLVVKDWQNQDKTLGENLDSALTLLKLERAFQGAFPHLYQSVEGDQKNEKNIYFEGTSEEVRWVSSLSLHNRLGLTAWRLRSDESEGLQLYLYPAFAANPDEGLEKVEPLTIFNGYEAQFQYLAEDKEGKKEWLSEWTAKERQSLPLAVHLVLKPNKKIEVSGPLEMFAFISAHEHYSIRPIIP